MLGASEDSSSGEAVSRVGTITELKSPKTIVWSGRVKSVSERSERHCEDLVGPQWCMWTERNLKISPSSDFKEAKQNLSERNLKETREKVAEKARAAPPLPSMVTGQITQIKTLLVKTFGNIIQLVCRVNMWFLDGEDRDLVLDRKTEDKVHA